MLEQHGKQDWQKNEWKTDLVYYQSVACLDMFLVISKLSEQVLEFNTSLDYFWQTRR